MVRKRKSFKSRKAATTLSVDFPPDLLAQILGRLPVKTLLQFRSVSKEWRSFIDSSRLSSAHFTLYNKNRPNPPLFVIEEGRNRRRCSVRRVDTFRRTSQADLPLPCDILWPVDYANGFVLCCQLDDSKVLGFVLFNPSTKKSIQIPYPSPSYFIPDIEVVLLDPSLAKSNGYKLVIIPFDHPSWHTGKRRRRVTKIPSTVVIEVYSFTPSSWRRCRIDSKCIHDLKNYYRKVVPLNGALHWIGHSPVTDKPCVVVFDVQNGGDPLRYFSLPAVPLKLGDRNFVKLSVLRESLALVKKEDAGYHVWVMERYGVDESWVNRVKVDANYADYFVHLRSNGELYFGNGYGVKVCDIESEGREIRKVSESFRDRIALVDTFVETLDKTKEP